MSILAQGDGLLIDDLRDVIMVRIDRNLVNLNTLKYFKLCMFVTFIINVALLILNYCLSYEQMLTYFEIK